MQESNHQNQYMSDKMAGKFENKPEEQEVVISTNSDEKVEESNISYDAVKTNEEEILDELKVVTDNIESEESEIQETPTSLSGIELEPATEEELRQVAEEKLTEDANEEQE